MMKALTVLQPWASAIARGWKPIENRTWVPPPGLIGKGVDLAIHAGRSKMDEDDLAFVRDMIGSKQSIEDIAEAYLEDFGKVLAVAQITDYVKDFAAAKAAVGAAGAEWFIEGQNGWVLGKLRKLKKPVLCRGQQGIWELPPAVEREVRAQL